ncbi:Pau24p, partial [Saccharomyces cerevisiae YJM1356]|jgi:hypothetical protein
MVKL